MEQRSGSRCIRCRIPAALSASNLRREHSRSKGLAALSTGRQRVLPQFDWVPLREQSVGRHRNRERFLEPAFRNMASLPVELAVFPHSRSCLGSRLALGLSRSRDSPLLRHFPTEFAGMCCIVCAIWRGRSQGHTRYSVFVLDPGGISPLE